MADPTDIQLTALAAAASTAVAQAVGKDAWEALKGRLAAWFGRGDAAGEAAAERRLQATASVIAEAETPQAEQNARAEQAALWRVRFENFLATLSEPERARAAAELRSSLAQASDTALSADVALISGGKFSAKAEGEGVAISVLQGGLHIHRPTRPAPPQG